VRSTDNTVERKARLYAKAPLKELFRRHWIESSSNIDVLEQQMLGFFELSTLDEAPKLAVAARASSSAESDWSTAQQAWFFRVNQALVTPLRRRLAIVLLRYERGSRTQISSFGRSRSRAARAAADGEYR
jgi:HTH-type transcriptional regulator/antitoxin HigA